MPHKQSRDFGEFIDLLKSRGFSPGTVIDVGVYYGTPELQGGFPDAYHVLVEPLSELEERMDRLLRDRRGERHMLALSDEPGAMLLQVNSAAKDGAALRRPEQGRGDAGRTVVVETLDRLLGDRNDLQGPILLKTDCQGLDLKVARGGARKLMPRVDVAILEVMMFRPAGDHALPDFGDTVAGMREMGFSVYDIISYQTRPLDGALGYVDLVFVRDDGPFRAHHRWG